MCIAPRRKENFFDPSPWRPLRLCGSPRGIALRVKNSILVESVFHGASHRLSDSLNPNSTENFQCLWLELVEPDRDPGGLGEAGTAETVGHAEGRTVVKNLGVIL